MMKQLIATLLLTGVFYGTGRAQDAGPVIRTESREVLVDAVAVDKKGKFATDLTEKDFRVWEDGREQQINGFSLESSGVTAERPASITLLSSSIRQRVVRLHKWMRDRKQSDLWMASLRPTVTWLSSTTT